MLRKRTVARVSKNEKNFGFTAYINEEDSKVILFQNGINFIEDISAYTYVNETSSNDSLTVNSMSDTFNIDMNIIQNNAGEGSSEKLLEEQQIFFFLIIKFSIYFNSSEYFHVFTSTKRSIRLFLSLDMNIAIFVMKRCSGAVYYIQVTEVRIWLYIYIYIIAICYIIYNSYMLYNI